MRLALRLDVPIDRKLVSTTGICIETEITLSTFLEQIERDWKERG